MEASWINKKEELQKRINELRIENFRSIKDATIHIKPFTVFCGANSCGKSTVLKSLLLQQQIVEEMRELNDPIPLNGKYVELGSFKDAVTRGSDAIKITRTIPWFDMDNDDDTYLEVSFTLVEGNGGGAILSRYEFKVLNLFENNNNPSTLAFIRDELPNKSACYRVELENWETRLEKFNTYPWRIEDLEADYEKAKEFFIERTRWNIVGFNALEEIPGNGYNKPTVPKSIVEGKQLDWTVKNYAYYIIADAYRKIVARLSSSFVDNIRGCFYIGPFRRRDFANARRQDIIRDVGIEGEFSKSVLEIKGNDKVRCSFKYPVESNEFEVYEESLPIGQADWVMSPSDYFGKRNISLQDAINECCDILKIGRLHIEDGRVKCGEDDLNNVGFGICQIFPLLLQTLLISKHTHASLIMEQPEVHLHPAFQMKLVDLFIAQNAGGSTSNSFIIETHSEHMINRLVRRVIEDGLRTQPYGIGEKVKIYFVESDENQFARFSDVVVDGDRGIVDWPKGFFDQSMDETEKTFDVLYKKMRLHNSKIIDD